MRVHEPLTVTDRVKIGLLAPFVVVAAVVLGVALRVHGGVGAALERIAGR